MRRTFLTTLLTLVTLIALAASGAFAAAPAAAPLTGAWQITHRPVDAAGKPCPFLPDAIQFFKDGTLSMSNMPKKMRLPFKTDPTADERQALEERAAAFKGQQLLLVKPNPRLDWRATPMVYIYTVSADTLTLNIQGWETATFKRSK